MFLSISISKFTQLLLDLAPEHSDKPDLVPEQTIRQELEIKQAEGQEDGDQVHAEPQCGRLHQAADGAEKVSELWRRGRGGDPLPGDQQDPREEGPS